MKVTRVIALSSVLVLAPQVLWAHAFLDRASPRVGNTIDRSPPEVRLWFTQKLEPRFSGIEVFGAGGEKIASGGVVDRARPEQMSLHLPTLKPGRYRVKWHVLSVDTHQTEGDFSFEIKP